MTPNEVLFHYSKYNGVHTLEIQNHIKSKPVRPVTEPQSGVESRLGMGPHSETESERKGRELSVSEETPQRKEVTSSLCPVVIHTRIDQYPVYDDIIRDRHRSMFSSL